MRKKFKIIKAIVIVLITLFGISNKSTLACEAGDICFGIERTCTGNIHCEAPGLYLICDGNYIMCY